jgi:hypothetical protein
VFSFERARKNEPPALISSVKEHFLSFCSFFTFSAKFVLQILLDFKRSFIRRGIILLDLKDESIKPPIRQSIEVGDFSKPAKLTWMEVAVNKGKTQGIAKKTLLDNLIGKKDRISGNVGIRQQFVNGRFTKALIKAKDFSDLEHEILLTGVNDPIAP